MLFIFSVQGEYVNRFIFKGKIRSIGEIILSGMVLQAIMVTVVAFFYRINIEYFCCNLLFTILLACWDKSWFLRLKKGWQWDKFCLILFVVIILLSLTRSSLLPLAIVDNDIYYIQTIKWLNEYGWVKGLANWHIFLANGSPWHALQAAYNFNFISGIFNDLNGFLVCVVSFLWIDKINTYRKNADDQTHRWLFFLPLFTILWFQFVNCPSTDLPLFLIPLVVIYHLLNRSEEGNLFAIFLLVFLVFIKLSIAPVLILLPFLLNKKNWKTATSYSLILGIIYLAKGIWLSGCPFAPYTGFSIPLPWTVPAGLNALFTTDCFHFQSIATNDLIDICFAFIIASTFILYAGMVWRKKEQYPVLIFFALQIIFILSTYAQLRYILPALFYPFAFILSKIKFSSRWLSILIWFFILTAFLPVFFKFDFGKINRNSTLLKTDIFQTVYILKPAGISKYQNRTFKKASVTNIDYFHPVDGSKFMFLTGDGPLPCAKTNYLYYMYLNTHCLPALYDKTDLGKGFYPSYIEPSSEFFP
jgi:hypothetical protein